MMIKTILLFLTFMTQNGQYKTETIVFWLVAQGVINLSTLYVLII